jgi:hypothetical protein
MFTGGESNPWKTIFFDLAVKKKLVISEEKKLQKLIEACTGEYEGLL